MRHEGELGLDGAADRWFVLAVVLLFIFLPSLGLASLYALIRGGAPERLCAVELLGALAASAYFVPPDADFSSFQPSLFEIDLALLVALLALALRAARLWPLAICSFQLVPVAGHVVRLIDPTWLPWLYWLTSSIWSLPGPFILAAGTLAHRRRLVRDGADRSWSHSSSPTHQVAEPN